MFDPKAVSWYPITPREDQFFIKLPCYDFVWSGNDNDRIRSIVSRIMLNNPGRAIPPNKIVEFQEAFSLFDKVRSFQYIKLHDYGYVIIYEFTVYIIICGS